MFLPHAIDEFLLYLHHEQNASPNTSKSYESALRRFSDWLATQGLETPPVGDITTALARRYLYHLNECGLRPRTRLRLWAALRAFFRMLVERGVLPEHPLQGITLPKKDPARRPLVSDEELLAVLEAAGRGGTPWQTARDQAVLAVLIFTGLRRTEVLDIRLRDVDLTRGLLYVAHGKGNKARMVPLCMEAREYVARWLEIRQVAQHDYLWAFGQTRRLHPNGLAKILERAKDAAGYGGAENIKPHSIRHRAATRLLQNGADIRAVQAWLGHSNLSTTAIYLHCDEKRLQAIAHLAAFGPRVEEAPAPPATPKSDVTSRDPHVSTPASRFRRTPRRERGGDQPGGLR